MEKCNGGPCAFAGTEQSMIATNAGTRRGAKRGAGGSQRKKGTPQEFLYVDNKNTSMKGLSRLLEKTDQWGAYGSEKGGPC